MNPTSLYHLVILFEEYKSVLTNRICYKSPSLPYPFIIQKPSSLGGCKRNKRSLFGSLGGRKFSRISVETYNFDIIMSTEDLTKGNEFVEEKIKFYSGNPTVETTEGLIHIFKNKREVSRSDMWGSSTMLCIFPVPSHITVKDLLKFVAPMRGAIEELKVVRHESPSGYMALLKFRTPLDTNQFFDAYNNTCYNSLESDVCQLVYVSHVEFTNPSTGVYFPTKDLRELPSCPVCLERLDEPVQGILTTILCNHTFHDKCISRVEDTICPVCRYVQSPEIIADSQCADCNSRENLWICLICGRVGCGRYGQKHAETHFKKTGHTFALELGKTLVWDYADDAYVHRLAVNHEDGKLVQLGPGSETGNKKIDLLSMEFSAVLTSQLESQRMYFEEQLNSLCIQSNLRVEEAENKAEMAMKTARASEEKLAEIMKENSTYSRKLQQATSLAHKLQKELEEERALNKSLLSNEETWRTRTEHAETEAKLAREECRELLLNLELRDKLEQISLKQELSKDELQNCEISLQSTRSTTSRRKKKR